MNSAIRLLFTACLLLSLSAVTSRAADPATFTVGTFTFKRPAAWKWVAVAPNSMRKAQLRVEGEGGQSADVVFFTFGAGQGGGVEQNVARWVGQFEQGNGAAVKPVEETAEIKGTKVTRVRVDSGTFNSGMPGGPTTPQADYGLYGAILESKDGDVFIKLTGPAALVRAAAADFEALIQSPFFCKSPDGRLPSRRRTV